MGRIFKKIEVGEVINDMLVISEERDFKNNRRMLRCVCNVCKNEKLIYEGNLRDRPNSSKHETSCNFGIKKSLDRNFHEVWSQMKARIYNPNNPYYNRYGGRGLTTDYDNYVDFFNDEYLNYIKAKAMYPNQKISIDRVDNNLGYVKGNIRWTIPVVQARNSTTVRKFVAQAPNGQLYLTNNQIHFGLNHGLESKHISDCLRGKQATTGGGWRFYEIDPLFEFNFDNDPKFIKELYY